MERQEIELQTRDRQPLLESEEHAENAEGLTKSTSLSEIVQLANDGAAAGNYRYGENRLTATQLLCRQWTSMSGKETSQWLHAFHSLLSLRVDVTLEDAQGNTVLHTAVSCRCPASAITHLVELTSIDVNRKNKNEETALHILLNKERQKVDREVLRSLVRGGADITVAGKDGQTPLHLLLDKAERECMSLINIVQEYQAPTTMLNCIMMNGTAAQMKMLLQQCDRRGSKVESYLIVKAACSSACPRQKIEMLMARDMSIHAICPNSGENMLHKAVLCGNMAVLTMALENGVPRIPDNNGDLPIHIAASSVGTAESLAHLLRPDLKNVKNRAKSTPLTLAVRSGNQEKVEMLLQYGCMPTKSKLLKHVPHEKLLMLTIPKVISESPQPLMFCLQMVEVFNKASAVQDLNKEECLATAKKMVSMAVDLVNESKIFPSDEVIDYAISQKIKGFIACCTVQKHLTRYWYVSDHESGTDKLRLIRNVIIYFLLCPFLGLSTLPHSIRQFINMQRCPVRPYVQYTSYLVSYIIFLLLLVTHVVSVKDEPRCKIEDDLMGCSFNIGDWILYLYVIALNIEGLSHLRKLRIKFKTNAKYDAILTALAMILLNIYFIITIVFFYANFTIPVKSQAIRVAFYFLSVGFACSFYHFLQLLKSHSVLGPIQISVEHMLIQTVGYLIYLIFQLMIMSSVITGIYGAESQRLGMLNESIPQPPAAEGFGKALEYFYFSMFGLTELDVFTSKDNASPASVEEVIAIILFAIWLTAFSIFFLSMVVAFVTNAYQAVQDNSEIERKFAKAAIIRQVLETPPLPIPLNIFYYMFQILSCDFQKWKGSRRDSKESADQAMDATDSASQRQMMNCYLDNASQKNEDSAVTKKDLIGVYSELNNLKVCIAAGPSLPQSQLLGSNHELNVSAMRLKLHDFVSPLAGSMAKLADSVHHLETRLSSIESKFDNTIV